jgi:hypothetical protein
MDFPQIIHSIEASSAGEWMRTSLKAMPVVEFLHVFSAALVFGTILIVDLRLLGFPDTRRAITRLSNEMLPLTWTAFGVSVMTGLLMFAANAHTYVGNMAFRLKLLALLLAGVNMLVFQRVTHRSIAHWDQGMRTPTAGRVAAVLSLLVWVTVICLARWIGFTKGYDFKVPDNTNINFSF